MILITGMSGSGKTTYARQYSKSHQIPIFEIDQEVRARACLKYKITQEWVEQHSYLEMAQFVVDAGKEFAPIILKEMESINVIIEGVCIYHIDKDVDLSSCYLFAFPIISFEETNRRRIKRYENLQTPLTPERIVQIRELYHFEKPLYQHFLLDRQNEIQMLR